MRAGEWYIGSGASSCDAVCAAVGATCFTSQWPRNASDMNTILTSLVNGPVSCTVMQVRAVLQGLRRGEESG